MFPFCEFKKKIVSAHDLLAQKCKNWKIIFSSLNETTAPRILFIFATNKQKISSLFAGNIPAGADQDKFSNYYYFFFQFLPVLKLHWCSRQWSSFYCSTKDKNHYIFLCDISKHNDKYLPFLMIIITRLQRHNWKSLWSNLLE